MMTISANSENVRRRGLLRRFSRDTGGATAIEFAALAVPFVALLFAILETCISFGGQQLLANAADDVARQMRTGQLRQADIIDGKLKQKICDRIVILASGSCNDNLWVDLQTKNTFAEIAAIKIQYKSDGDFKTDGFKAELGPAMSKNVLRVFYKWPLMIDYVSDIISTRLSNTKTRHGLHFAEVVWQNEPFND